MDININEIDKSNDYTKLCRETSNLITDKSDREKTIKLLSEIPNVNCKLSGLMAYCAPGTSSYETIEPYVDHVLNTFGPKRIVWGSDWPVVNLGKGLEEWISVTRKILDKLSPDESKLIAHANAEKIYKSLSPIRARTLLYQSIIRDNKPESKFRKIIALINKLYWLVEIPKV